MLSKSSKKESISYQVALISRSQAAEVKGHLSSLERDKITILQGEGYSIRKIASILGRSPSTISRELNRSQAVYYRWKYLGSQTHKKVKEDWLRSHNKPKLNNKKIRTYVIKCLKIGISPELIAGRLRTKYGFKIYHETIYKFIYATHNELHLTQYLHRRKFGRISRDIRKHNKRTYTGTGKNIPNRVDIDLRPIEANLRLEFGHFEADSIESKRVRGQQKSCLTVLTERQTRLTRIRKTASHTSQETVSSIVSIKDTIHCPIISITYDNGKEFTQHEKINKMLNTKSYFCKPYCSWEKGTVENINGLIRRFFPKGTDFDTITTEEIQRVEDWINNRPMKVLGYKTPYEKYIEVTLNNKCCV